MNLQQARLSKVGSDSNGRIQVFRLQQESQPRLSEEESQMPLLRQQDALQAETGFDQGSRKMKYEATIVVDGDAKIHECMEQELIDYDRASFSMEKDNGKLRFVIEAKDAVALRATLNAITQSLTVYEKVAKKEL